MKPKTTLIRMILLGFSVVLVFSLFALRLMQFQVVEGADMIEEIEAGSTSTQIIKASRGEILDRNGRPLAVNTIGRDVVIDQAYLERGSVNTVILKLCSIMEASGEDWIDNLPITDAAPFAFKPGEAYEPAIATLKRTLEIEQYATVDDVMFHLLKKYGLDDPELGYSEEDCRKIVGVRYEMTRCGFSMAVPYTFATNIKIETVPKIMERSFELSGVNVVENSIRQYVSGDIAPHIIGSVGSIYKEEWEPAEKITDGPNVFAKIGERYYTMNDTIGKDGVEKAFEQYLKGTDGKRQIVQNSRGQVLEVIEEQATVPGNTVVLTLDSRLQKVAQDSLAKKIVSMQNDLAHYPVGKGHEADAGAVVAVEIETGDILVAATYPSYDRSTYYEDYDELASSVPGKLFNRAVDAAYTPGSIFKPTVALGALDTGMITADERIPCNMIYTRFSSSGYEPRCLSSHGNITVMDALRYSCNIFFYEAGFRLGIDRLDEYAAHMGFGQPTGIEIQENVGRMSSKELKAKLHPAEPDWFPADTVQASIGQFDTMASPVQLANYCATLASNGERKKVTLLKSVRSYSLDETVYEHEPEVVDRVDAPEAFNSIRQGMVSASRIGTAASTFGSYAITVASKTGTPETAMFPNSTFIAYAPAEDPKIAVCVIIEKGWHGYTGAPVARDIFDAYFNITNTAEKGAAEYGTLLP